MLLARTIREVAGQGNIRTSNSGRNFSGQNKPAIPKIREKFAIKKTSAFFIISGCTFLRLSKNKLCPSRHLTKVMRTAGSPLPREGIRYRPCRAISTARKTACALFTVS